MPKSVVSMQSAVELAARCRREPASVRMGHRGPVACSEAFLLKLNLLFKRKKKSAIGL